MKASHTSTRVNQPKQWRLARDASWLVLGQIGATLAVVAGIRVMTEVVSPSIYGEVTLCIGVGLLALNVCAYPYSQAAVRFYPEVQREDRTEELYAAIRTDLVPTTLILACGLLVAGVVQRLLHRGTGVSFLAVTMVFAVDVVRTIQLSFFNASRNQRSYAIWSAADAWIRPIAGVAAVLLFGASAASVLIGYAVGVALLMPLLYTRLGSRSHVDSKQDSMVQLRRSLRRYAIPLIPLAFTTWFSTFGDRYIIRVLLSSADVGVYAAVYGLASRPFNICNMVLLNLFRPIYFEHLAHRDSVQADRLFRKWLLCAAVILGLGALVAYFAKGLIGWLALSATFRSGIYLIPPIAFGHALMALAQTMNVVSLGHNKPQFATAAEVVGAVSSIIAVPMIYRFGITGAAWAVPIYYGLQLIVASGFAAYSRRHWHGVSAPHRS